MPADIDPKNLLLKGQFLTLFKFSYIRIVLFVFLLLLLRKEIKEAHLPGDTFFPLPVYLIHHHAVDGHKLLSRSSQTVQRPGLYQVLNGALINLLGSQPLHKILQIAVRASPLSFIHHILDDCPAKTLDRSQAIPDGIPGYGETRLSFIYVGRQDTDSHSPACVDILCYLIGVSDDRSQQGCHKFYRIETAEPGCLIGNYGIGRRVGFVKGIFGEINHLIKDLICHLLGYTTFYAAIHTLGLIAIDKILPLFLHHVPFFLGHGTSYQVAPAKGVPGQFHDDLHYLFLINDTAVGGRKDLFQFRAGIGDGIFILLTFDVFGDKIHGTRTIEGDTCNDIFDVFRF